MKTLIKVVIFIFILAVVFMVVPGSRGCFNKAIDGIQNKTGEYLNK